VPQPQARVYVVQSGDSLSKIAKEILGDAKRWPEIFEANKDKIKDPNLIYPGRSFAFHPKRPYRPRRLALLHTK
jgi:nucleoid-associated protein YgaU